MNSSHETNSTISTQETPLLQQNSTPPPPPPRIKNLKPKLLFLLRILIVLIVGFVIIYTIYTKNQNHKPQNPYLSGLSKYYCHLTRHRKLCRDSMSAVIADPAAALERNPARIFTSSLQLVADELNHTHTAISTIKTKPRLSTCQTLVNDSLSRLNKSLGLLGVDLFFGSLLPYLEETDIRDEVKAVKDNCGKCLLSLQQIERTVMGVEEVRVGVEKASKLAVNFISLFDRRETILDDYYNRFSFDENEGYNFLYNYYYFYFGYGYGFDYFFLVCLFGTMYLFIGLLYIVFWQQ